MRNNKGKTNIVAARVHCSATRKTWRAMVIFGIFLPVAFHTRTGMAQLTSIPFAGAAAGRAPGTGVTVCSTALDTVRLSSNPSIFQRTSIPHG